MDTDINIKGLVKLGKALAGLADAVEIIESKDQIIRGLDEKIAARQQVLADLGGDLAKAKDAIADAKADAKVIAAKAKQRDEECRIKADMDAQEVMKNAQAALDQASEQVKVAEIRKAEIEREVAAKSEQVAVLAKQEADILARIAAEKARVIKSLEAP